MDIETIQGNRSKDDRIVTIRTYGQEILSLRAILRMLELMFQNEDRLHPRPKEKGRLMLFDAITEVCNGKDSDKVADYYLLPKAIKQAKQVMLERMTDDERQKHLDMFGEE